VKASAVAVAVCIAVSAAAAGAADLNGAVGRALFERIWTSAPASTASSDGLGPLFNARSCAACHSGPALAARTVPGGSNAASEVRGLVVRFGTASGAPDPVYGRDLQVNAVQGLRPEGRVHVVGEPASSLDEVTMELLRGPLSPDSRRSVRLAPALAGRAALEDIDKGAVLRLADPDDRNGDGVSGRARLLDGSGAKAIGRYGWKAANPTLEHQIADAFAHDLGMSSSLAPLAFGDCTKGQPDCLAAPHGEGIDTGEREISDPIIEAVAAFLRDTKAPIRPGSSEGFRAFGATGCAACHVPELPTAHGGTVAAYSDLLLHDMGPSLDDGVGEPGVLPSEWRTAPLIAIAAGTGRRYLHDGRAPDIDTAIRLHGGEASRSRSAYEQLSEAERQILLRFVQSL
jgi:CxxC motif-containing protein (DUF1111 family)